MRSWTRYPSAMMYTQLVLYSNYNEMQTIQYTHIRAADAQSWEIKIAQLLSCDPPFEGLDELSNVSGPLNISFPTQGCTKRVAVLLDPGVKCEHCEHTKVFSIVQVSTEENEIKILTFVETFFNLALDLHMRVTSTVVEAPGDESLCFVKKIICSLVCALDSFQYREELTLHSLIVVPRVESWIN